MPYILDDLTVDRVDLVNEGANSAAFIEIFKRKETEGTMDFAEIISKMKPEHAEVINQHVANLTSDLEKARGDLDVANQTIAEKTEALDAAEATIATYKAKEEEPVAKSAEENEEEVLKSLPENLRESFIKMKEQRDAAEEQVRKAAEEKVEAEAVAKAATLKALPVEQSVLVDILKKCDQNVVDVLGAAAEAIESTILAEVGKSKAQAGSKTADPWSAIESKADEIVARDSVTKQRAIGIAIKENPELYKEYLDGGAN